MRKSSGGLAVRRAALAHELSKYVPVHGNRALASVAPHGSNMKYYDVPHKLPFVARFSHHLCFENESHPGYLTEKIFDPIQVGSVPLYGGDPLVREWFDKRAYLDCTGLTAREIADQITLDTAMSEFVASKREKACLVPLDAMRKRIIEFQRLVAESITP